MRKDLVLELKNDVLKSLWTQTAQQRGMATQTQGIANPNVESRLAVGYSQVRKGKYRLELRVQRGHGTAYELAKEFKKKAKQEANIEEIPSIKIPSRTAVLDFSGLKGLTERKRPLHLGLSIGHASDGAGTLGAFVSDSQGKECILSNNHVLALMGSSELEDPIYQPGRPDMKRLTALEEIASVSNYFIITKDDRDSADAAIAVLNKNMQHESNRIPKGLGFPMEGRMIKEVTSSESLLELLKRSTPVCKIGRTTGFTEGRIGAVSLDNITVETAIGNVVFDNLIEIDWESNRKPFSAPGDSGSLVFTKTGQWAVGLHFAGGEKKVNQRRVGVSYSCNMATILETLKISLLD